MFPITIALDYLRRLDKKRSQSILRLCDLALILPSKLLLPFPYLVTMFQKLIYPVYLIILHFLQNVDVDLFDILGAL
jgi:hypothetical protein